jgi:hypothetical protein
MPMDKNRKTWILIKSQKYFYVFFGSWLFFLLFLPAHYICSFTSRIKNVVVWGAISVIYSVVRHVYIFELAPLYIASFCLGSRRPKLIPNFLMYLLDRSQKKHGRQLTLIG